MATLLSPAEWVLLSGLAIGLAFGAGANLSGFCLHRGLNEAWAGRASPRLGAFAVALAVALAGTQLLVLTDVVDTRSSLYLIPAVSWLLLPVGGLLFGYGMALANGCGARALVLLGQGNLRSLMVLLCLGISAYMTLTGVLAPIRSTLFDLTTLNLPWTTISDPATRAVVVLAATGVLLFLASQGKETRRRDWLGGALVGLLVVAGWFATGYLGNDDFDPAPVTSLTFVAPIGDSIHYAMIATGMNLRFGIVIVIGVLIGSTLVTLVRRNGQLQGFDSPRHMVRSMTGGVLMGCGGALAYGCSIGQGLTGLSTLSISSVVVTACIIAGSRLAWAASGNS